MLSSIVRNIVSNNVINWKKVELLLFRLRLLSYVRILSDRNIGRLVKER